MVRLPGLVFLSTSLILVACSASDDASSSPTMTGGSGSAAAPTLATAECSSRCKAKLTTCQAPSADADQGCAQLCGTPITEAQASCFEATDCGTIARSEAVASLCPAGGTTSQPAEDAGKQPAGALPTAVTITGTFPASATATHASGANGSIISFFSAAATPSITPSSSGNLPNLADKSLTVAVSSPSLGDCAATFSFTLNSGQVGVQVSGSDTGTANACGAFTDAIARDGLEFVLSKVPYQSTPSTTSTVTLKLSK